MQKLATRIGIAFITIAAGCSPEPPPPAADGTPQPAAGCAFVEVDNGSSDTWNITVDGAARGDIRPYGVLGMELKTGDHEIVVRNGVAEVDRMKVKVEADRVTVVNPGATSTYRKITTTYTSGSPFMGGTGPMTETVTGQRVVTVDFGLLQAIPGSISVRTASGPFNFYTPQTARRTKLARETATPLSGAQALGILNSSPNIYDASGTYSVRELYRDALVALRGMSNSAALRDSALHLLNDKEHMDDNDTMLVQAAFGALRPYEPELPHEQVLAWLTAPCASEGGAMPYRVQQAVRILVVRGQAGAVIESFPKLGEFNRIAILREAAERGFPAPTRAALVLLALQNSAPGTDQALGHMFRQETFDPDMTVAQAVEAHLQQLPGETHNDKSRRDNLRSAWAHALLHKARTSPDRWMVDSFRRFLDQQDQAAQYSGVQGLINTGNGREVAASLSKLQPGNRTYAINAQLSRNRSEETLLDETYLVCFAGAQDPDAKVRKEAIDGLDELARRYKVWYCLTALEETLLREPDEGLRKDLTDRIAALKSPSGPMFKFDRARPGLPTARPVAAAVAPPPAMAAAAPAPAATASGAWPVLNITGIMKSGNSYAALINNDIVSEGQTVQGIQIISITKSEVKGSYRGETRSLPIGGAGR